MRTVMQYWCGGYVVEHVGGDMYVSVHDVHR